MRRLLAWSVVLALCGALVPARAGDAPEEKVGGKASLTIDNGGHVGVIGGMVFTPDGKRLITVGHDQTIQEYDPSSGRRLRVVRPPVGGIAGGRLNGVALIRGSGEAGKVLAVVGSGLSAAGKGRSHRLFLLHRDTGGIIPLRLGGMKTKFTGPEALAGLPDMRRVATASGEQIKIHAKLASLWGEKPAA